jgi:uncharacterized protein YjbJ (UPF0337 family)
MKGWGIIALVVAGLYWLQAVLIPLALAVLLTFLLTRLCQVLSLIPLRIPPRSRLAVARDSWRGLAHRSSQRRQAMKPSTKDKAQGTFHEVKGKVKEKVGRATNNPDLEAEGQVEKIGGKVQKKIGQVKKVLGT